MIRVDSDEFSERLLQGTSNFGELSAVQYALTYRCNIACVHCYAEGAGKGSPPELSAAEVRRYFGQLAQAGCLNCTVTGGEPLARRDFEEIWTAIAEQGIRRMLFTNATLIDARKAAFLKEMPPDWIEVTILGADATTHDALTRSPGSFEAALFGIRAMEKAGLRVRIKTIVMRGNADQIGAIKHLASTLGDGSFRLDGQLMGSFMGHIDIDTLRVPPGQLAGIEETYGDIPPGAWEHEKKRLSGFKRRNLYSCGAATKAAYLSPWGDLHPCLTACHISQPLRGSSVEEAWVRLKEDVGRRPFPENHTCSGCPAFPFCQNCPPAARLDSGDELGVSQYRCALAKEREKRYNSRLIEFAAPTNDAP